MEPKLVHAHVRNPKNALFKEFRNDKATCVTVTCRCPSQCGLLERGQCCILGLSPQGCPYGSRSSEVGFTRRAQKFGSWISERMLKYKDVPHLGSPSNVMALVGDYIFLPYDFMMFDSNNTLVDLPFRGGSGFLKLVDFTVSLAMAICEHHPRALMGGEIKDYQKKSVPLFIRHLSELLPEFFSELKAAYPKAGDILASTTDVGRKAVLGTLTPNVGVFTDIHKGTWVWDGEYLTSRDSHASFMLVSKFTELRIKPDPGCEVVVTDEGQVNKGTKFLS